MTYNILLGLRWRAVRELIDAHPVDILCLQEVPEAEHADRRVVRLSRIIDHLDRPHDLGMLWNRSPHRCGNLTLVPRGGHLAPGRPLAVAQGTPLAVAQGTPYGWANDVEVSGVRLTIANVHFTEMLGPPLATFAVSEIYRLREALDLTRRFGHHRGPVIALGDFNTFWPAPACWVMHRHWTDCRSAAGGRHLATRPTYGLPFVIDHIFLRGGISVTGYQVVPGGGSDHRAVIATLQVPRPRPGHTPE
jgi:endonuclease/exonuclease/phosphatase family metal-dependent hydrolase